MGETTPVPDVDLDQLREAIQCEYREVARAPQQGFHFHTGRRLAQIVAYRDEWLEGIPEGVIDCFAGTGNPFSIAPLRPGERVVDLGCGAGIDSFIAARQIGETGAVIGIDMTPEMLDKARRAGQETGQAQVEFRQGYLEELPVADDWADVVISNGVVNLCPDKMRAYHEIHRVLKPGGRMQIADIMVHKPVSAEAKRKIDLWTG
jgi:ubiquinone/menaquinone biosynthesis C-methylase UbiE